MVEKQKQKNLNLDKCPLLTGSQNPEQQTTPTLWRNRLSGKPEMLGHSLRMRASVRLPPTHSWPAGRLRRCACVLGWPAGCKAERRADIFLVPAPLVPDLPRTGPELSLAWWVRAIGQGLREPASEVRRPRRTAEWALASASPARCRARLRRPAEGRQGRLWRAGMAACYGSAAVL